MISAIRRALALATVGLIVVSCGGAGNQAANLIELQRAKSGDLEIVLLGKSDALKAGKDEAVLEFRTGADRHLVDVGTVKANASMSMAGMGPMLGTAAVQKGDTPGRYVVSTELSMAGAWRLTIEWDGPAGKGSVTMPGTVR